MMNVNTSLTSYVPYKFVIVISLSISLKIISAVVNSSPISDLVMSDIPIVQISYIYLFSLYMYYVCIVLCARNKY